MTTSLYNGYAALRGRYSEPQSSLTSTPSASAIFLITLLLRYWPWVVQDTIALDTPHSRATQVGVTPWRTINALI